MSQFWCVLHKLTGTKLKLSTAYHLQTNGASEHTNKTVNQCIHFHVEWNQKGWVWALPHIQFNIMSTINKSTGFCSFQLKMGQMPQILPPLITINKPSNNSKASALEVIRRIHIDTLEACDNLARAKISQSAQANKTWTLTFFFRIGNRVQLSTKNRHHKFRTLGLLHVAKFMPRYDDPFKILSINKSKSTVTLNLPVRGQCTCQAWYLIGRGKSSKQEGTTCSTVRGDCPVPRFIAKVPS